MYQYKQRVRVLFAGLGFAPKGLDAIAQTNFQACVPALKAVENHFKRHPISIKGLKPLQADINQFPDPVRILKRPYMAISEKDWSSLYDGGADFYLTPQGRVVTFGNADLGFALMPVNSEVSALILAQQEKSAA